jgi:hypothetical protein
MVTAPSLSPPKSAETYDFSLNRNTGLFRWRLNDDEWHCSRIAGSVRVLHADGKRGHLILRGVLTIKNGTAHIRRPDDDDWDFDSNVIQNESGDWICQWNPGEQAEEDGIFFTYDPSVYDLSDFPSDEHHRFRLCYVRAGEQWRVRHECMTPCSIPMGRLWLFRDYQGVINVDWFDGSTHIYHEGCISPDIEHRIAVLY